VIAPFVSDPDFTLYHGNALDVLRELPDDLAHCIVTSPPYYLLRDYEVEGQIGLERSLGDYVEALVGVFHEARRVLHSDGVFWLNMGDTHSAAQRGPRHGKTSTLSTPERQDRVSPVVNKRGRHRGVKPKDLFLVPFEVARALRDDGWWLRQTVIWDKTNTIPESAKDRPTTSHEYLFLLAKSRRYWYDDDAIAEPATWERWGAQTNRKDVVGKARIAREPWPGIGKKSAEARAGATDGGDQDAMVARETRNARSVWRGNCAQFEGDHAAVMPDWLAERCILAGCPAEGLVLDPFAGAGTTSRAARKLARRSIAIEISESSCVVAAQRLAQLSLLAEAAS
jgi:DNA modification methylase